MSAVPPRGGRAFFYSRFSSQTDSDEMEVQQAVCREFAKRHGWDDRKGATPTVVTSTPLDADGESKS